MLPRQPDVNGGNSGRFDILVSERVDVNWISRYTHWLHTMWPAGTVEKLPDAREDGTTALPGVRIVGDLTGVPLFIIGTPIKCYL